MFAQDYKNLWNQCQRYNTIALDTYKKCYGQLDQLTAKHEEFQADHNQTKLELMNCQELTSKFTLSLQRSNTIALEAYQECNGKLNICNEKQKSVQEIFNQTKIELSDCESSTSKYTVLMAIPWILLGKNDAKFAKMVCVQIYQPIV